MLDPQQRLRRYAWQSRMVSRGLRDSAVLTSAVHTGEEAESTSFSVRTKLYVMQADGGWRERGVGTLKLNVRRSDGKGARLGALPLHPDASLFQLTSSQ